MIFPKVIVCIFRISTTLYAKVAFPSARALQSNRSFFNVWYESLLVIHLCVFITLPNSSLLYLKMLLNKSIETPNNEYEHHSTDYGIKPKWNSERD
jgi:hypothetical protein